jgi:DNA-binding transcriptional LysR family regulator
LLRSSTKNEKRPGARYQSNGALDLDAVRASLSAQASGSFRAAAALAHVKPSVVSRQIRRLEDFLGVSLFHRTSRGSRPTNAGTVFLNACAGAIDLLEQAVHAARQAGAGEQGTLAIGLIWTIANGEARTTLSEQRRIAPDVEISIREGGAAQIAAAVFDRVLDVGFLAGRYPLHGLDQHRVWSEQMMLVLPEADAAGLDAAHWSDLARGPILVGDHDDWTSLQRYLESQADLKFTYVVHRCSREAILSLIVSGAGITVAPASTSFRGTPGVAFVPIDEPGATIPLYAVWLPSNDNPALRRFLSLLRRLYPVKT